MLITTDVAGGVWTFVEELAEGLVQRGHELGIIALGGDPDRHQRRWLTEHLHIGSFTVEAPLEWMPEPAAGLEASVPKLREVVRRFGPDVLHLNQFFYGAQEWGVPTVVTAHSDVLSWWREVKGEAPPNDAWFARYRRWVEAGLRGADARAAPTAWLARETERTFGCPPVRHIHNARTAAPWLEAAVAQREPLVITAGRLWDEGKGARDLANAAPLIPGARIVAVGAAEHPAGGDSFPTRAPGVVWQQKQPAAELRRCFGRAAVYAATSRYEPFGLAPLEAALAGCALVMSDIPTFRELWDGCADFYPAGDAEALAAACNHLLVNSERRRHLAAAARERALDRFSPQRMAAEYEQLYEEVAGRR